MFTKIFILFFLFAATAGGQIITNNLVADYQAGAGYTLTEAGQVSQWSDQHNTLNNDGVTNNAVQSDPVLMPLATTDRWGDACVLYPNGEVISYTNPVAVGNALDIPATLTCHSRTSSVYAVCTGPYSHEAQCLLQFTNWAGSVFVGWRSNQGASEYWPMSPLTANLNDTNIFPPMNKAVFTVIGSPTATAWFWNTNKATGAALAAQAFTGAQIGGNLIGSYYGGQIYRLLIYRDSHSDAQALQVINALIAAHNVRTNYSTVVVSRGESNTAGVNANRLKSWTWQLMERYPEVKWYNHGVGSSFISTNGTTGNVWYENDFTYVDLVYDSNAVSNLLFVRGNGNDLNTQGGSLPTFGRLTNYTAQRASRGWKVVVDTLGDGVNDVSNYNLMIRTNVVASWFGRVDSGAGSAVETRLTDNANRTYFYADGTHYVNAGHSVIRDHFSRWLDGYLGYKTFGAATITTGTLNLGP